ncbi:hypothetical protein OUQ49_33375 (plasmid) [Streptomyces cavourensis]|uniref:hypothetical protein n=1 Tax=Streptomyces TaxID=1883 RepID=UPI002278501D|nr:hypothetical protein [Streptomyces cavourensis]WAE70655.1 hypothetical protein OUQ49_33375 [Streptomyces cavourensis]
MGAAPFSYQAAHRAHRRENSRDLYFQYAMQACSRLGGTRRDRVQKLEQGEERRGAAAR